MKTRNNTPVHDLTSLLAPVSAKQPAGSELDGTFELNALEMAVREPEQASIQGVESEDERDWGIISQQAEALLRVSKDLRVAVQLARARLQTDGLPGFCSALLFLSELAQRFWPTVHPTLDLEDGDATARINALEELASAPVLRALRSAKLASAPLLGPISVKEALGSASSAGASQADDVSAHTLAALETLGLDGVRERLAHLQTARRELAALVTFVSDQTGHRLQISALSAAKGERAGLLDALERLLQKAVEQLTPEQTHPHSAADARQTEAAHPAAASATGDVAALRVGAHAITCREDVIATLGVLCAYYEQAEPSSPVPLLLRRAQRLVPLDFFAIIRELAQKGLPEVASLAGLDFADKPSIEQ